MKTTFFQKKIGILFFFGLLLFLAFLLRSGMFLHRDFIYLSDQSRDLLLAKNVVIDHKLTLIGGRTGFGGLFHGALWIYMITPFFILAKGDPFLTLIPLFELINLGIIVAGFFVGWKLYGKWMGLLFAFFLTLSRTLIDPTPVTTNAEMLPLVFIFYLYCIIRFMRGEEKYFIPTLFFIGLGFQFESAFAVLLIPLTLLAIVLKKKLPSVKIFIIGMGWFLLAVSTFIFFDLRHNFLMTSSVVKLFTTRVKPLPGYEQYANIGFRIHDRIINLWSSLFSPLYTKDFLTSAILILIIALGAFFLLKNIFSKKKIEIMEKEYIFVLLSPFLIFGIYILYPLPLWPHYILPISVLVVFILALSIKNIWTKPLLKFLILFFLAISILPALFFVKNGYIDSSEYIAASDGSYINQLEVAKWVVTDSKNKSAGYFVYTPGILTYSMDYLFWWLSQNEQTASLSNVKTTNTYLIMYLPLSGDLSAHAFWKKNVIKTTMVPIISKTFPGGIVVEKLNLSRDKEAVDPNYFQNLIFR